MIVAQVNVTWAGQAGDLPDTVPFDLSESEVLRVVQEAVAGGIPGIAADPNTDFSGYVVSRYPATDDLPINRIVVRPKTPFGKRSGSRLHSSCTGGFTAVDSPLLPG